jgi:hypothetical protein
MIIDCDLEITRIDEPGETITTGSAEEVTTESVKLQPQAKWPFASAEVPEQTEEVKWPFDRPNESSGKE